MKLSCWPSSCWEASWVTLAFRGAWRAWRRARVRWPQAWRARWPVPARGRGPGPDWGSARAARWCARVRWRAERQAILRQANLRQANLRQANLRQASARAAPRTRRRRALAPPAGR
ncbi:pentapeptide repeat-containing protein [Achromobacter sp. 413638]|uniref:pentapeptide repeat-containing protein n=1 Tax=Achromobacter sp. 413638 TaxID=3342385 RepID=UPI00370C700C